MYIPETLLKTLRIVEKLGRATSGDVRYHNDFKDRVTLSAVSNRLDDLYKAGLVTRIKTGSAWLYSTK
jgi:hypothetical protein